MKPLHFEHPEGTLMSNITTVGIIGAGTMGNGIAQACATSGIRVVMVTGDDVAIEEQKATVPGVHGVVVKRAINSRAVELRPLADARRDIEQAARESVAAAKKN
jgi:D-aminopeptidase